MNRPREVNLRIEDFAACSRVRGFEGGAVYQASRDGRFYVIVNETAAFDLLSEEDRDGLSAVRVLEFDTDADRTEYLRRRRWLPEQCLIDPD